MTYYFYFLLCWVSYNNALSVKIFLHNTNYGNVENWNEGQLPCDKSHIIFPSKSPKIFVNGSSSIYRISEMILPLDGVLILDDLITLTVTDITEETNCDVIISHYTKIQPDFWYNPLNWCQAKSPTSPCFKKPQIEASMVPSSSDSVVFQRKNAFRIGVKPSEAKIVAKEILLRGVLYRNSFLFQQKIRRTLKNKIVEFENINTNYPPVIELQGDKCKGDMCHVNSNLKRMKHICAYVTCRAVLCKKSVTPTGGCCQLCGQMFSVKVKYSSSKKNFEKWFEEQVENYYNTKLIFNILFVETYKLQIVMSSLDLDEGVDEALANKIVDKILMEKVLIGVESIEELSWTMTKTSENSYRGALITILIVFAVVILISILLVARRRFTFVFNIIHTMNFHIPSIPKIQFPIINFHFFQNPFTKTRLNEEVDTSTNPSVSFPPISGAIEVIELPEKVNDVSFDNPIYDSEITFEDSVQ